MPLKGRRVLLVEDEDLVALTLQEILFDAGCEVVGPCPRVAKALEVAKAAARLDVALLDVNLAGELVYPVADLLLERKVPFVFMTGYNAGEFPPQFADRPILAKPFDPDRLLDQLTAMLV